LAEGPSKCSVDEKIRCNVKIFTMQEQHEKKSIEELYKMRDSFTVVWIPEG
jgi:hypothetical protein